MLEWEILSRHPTEIYISISFWNDNLRLFSRCFCYLKRKNVKMLCIWHSNFRNFQFWFEERMVGVVFAIQPNVCGINGCCSQIQCTCEKCARQMDEMKWDADREYTYSQNVWQIAMERNAFKYLIWGMFFDDGYIESHTKWKCCWLALCFLPHLRVSTIDLKEVLAVWILKCEKCAADRMAMGMMES